MSTAELINAALALNARQRGQVIAALIKSLEAEADRPFENADESEMLRRMDARPASRRSHEAVKRSALERLRKRR